MSWIPSEAITGVIRIPFDVGIGHYDDPPPGELTDLAEIWLNRRHDRGLAAVRATVRRRWPALAAIAGARRAGWRRGAAGAAGHSSRSRRHRGLAGSPSRSRSARGDPATGLGPCRLCSEPSDPT